MKRYYRGVRFATNKDKQEFLRDIEKAKQALKNAGYAITPIGMKYFPRFYNKKIQSDFHELYSRVVMELNEVERKLNTWVSNAKIMFDEDEQ